MDAQLTVPLHEQLRRWIAENNFNHSDRLPAERDLSQQFDISRGELRKALAVLEADGLIWRHVGRGTFIGARPVLNLADVAYLKELTTPEQVIAARLAIEPELARLAAISGTKSDFESIRMCNQRCRDAPDWRSYEAWDNNLHYAVATATRCKLLVYLFDTLNVVRRSTVWRQIRTTKLPSSDHPSFSEHDEICAAVMARDASLASQRMRDHLNSVRERVLPALA